MLIATDRFHTVLAATRRLAGQPDLQWAEVPHPVQSLDQTGLRQCAQSAADQFANIVVDDRLGRPNHTSPPATATPTDSAEPQPPQ